MQTCGMGWVLMQYRRLKHRVGQTLFFTVVAYRRDGVCGGNGVAS